MHVPAQLKWLNLSAAILHYSLAIIFIGYYASLNRRYENQPVQGVETSLRDHAIDLRVVHGCTPNQGFCDASGNTITTNWASTETAVPSIKVIQGMLISFFLITGTFHMFYFVSEYKSGKDGYYQQAISNSNNFYRWIEYSITSTLMLYVISLISGVKDTNIYIMLCMNNVAMIYMGQLVEEKVRDRPDNKMMWIIPMFVSWALLISEWVVIVRNFTQRINQVNAFLSASTSPLTNGVKIPSWISLTVYILAFFFICFGFISLAGAIWGISYPTIEYAYIIASFVAKATLGIFIAYGTGQRQQGWTNDNPRRLNPSSLF